MKTIIELISNEVMTAFKEAGYDENMGKVTMSNRPDLCEYQCNGALAAAKQYHCAPIQIAKAVVAQLNAQDYSLVEAVNPGFINLKLSGQRAKIAEKVLKEIGDRLKFLVNVGLNYLTLSRSAEYTTIASRVRS